MLCRAEYGGTHQLHLAAKNYMCNYSLSAGLHQNRRIPYERALRNLTVLMFSHYVHQLESSRSLEGHRTLMVHECLQVAAALGRYHRWQCWVSHQEKNENTEWNKVPAVAKDDFWHKYSLALTLLGNAQNPVFTHPKLLGCCYDNVYHNGQLIGDLPARGKPPTEDQSKKIYTQEYQEVVTRIENILNLTEESLLYSIIPTSLVNLDIVLPHNLFQECRGLPEIPPGRNPEPREYRMDGAQGLVDLDWSQRMPIFHPDDIDRDPRFNQYPFQEGDDYEDDDEEDMEVESRPSGGASDTSMAPPTNTRHTYQCLPATYSVESAQTLGLPRSTHTDTDTATEMGGLSMAPGGPDLRRVTLRAGVPPVAQGAMSTLDLAASVACGVVAAVTQILERFTWPPQVNEANCPPVDLVADAAIRECFQRCLATTPQPTSTGQATPSRTSAFDRLGHRTLAAQEENEWAPRPEMTPHKIDCGRQPNKEQESQWAGSQKRQSQSQPHDEANPKKGRTEGEGKSGKIQVGIDWTNTGIWKPISKPDSHHPSFKLDVSGASGDQPPRMKSTVVKGSQRHTSGCQDRTCSQEGRPPHTSSNTQLGDPEKKEIRDKPHRWIKSRVKCLDLAGYMEEINSLRYFGRNAGCFALQIVAIANWGRKFMDVGFNYPIPTFPQFLFTPLLESHQGRAQVPVKPSQVNIPGGDVCDKSREAWKWMVAVLQFWGDEVSSADSVIYGARKCPVSALAEYVLNTINPGLEPGSKITWDDVVTWTPWMAKRLHGMTAAQEKTVRCQALPVPGVSSELEIVLERRYSEQVLSSSKGRRKLIVENPTAPGPKPVTSPPRLTKAGRGDVLKLHLKRATQGEGWSHVEAKDSGPDVGRPYQTPKEANKPQESEQIGQPGHSPLTSKLLALGEELIGELDYEDVEEADPSCPDPEIVQAVAHIPQANAWANVEMQESHSPLGFEPEVSRPGYDVNLVRTNPTEPGLTSPVTVREDKMLDGANSRTPGAGWPGTNENPGRTEDN